MVVGVVQGAGRRTKKGDGVGWVEGGRAGAWVSSSSSLDTGAVSVSKVEVRQAVSQVGELVL